MAAAEAISNETGQTVRASSAISPTVPPFSVLLATWIALDVLVNNAGLELITPMSEPGAEVEKTFARIIEINVIGTYYVTREALPLMRPGASIVITSSIWGKVGAADFTAYVTSKHANIGFMRALAKELGPTGIRVNAVCPGWVRTRAALRSLAEVAARAETSEDAMLGRNSGRTGLARPDGARRCGEYLSVSRIGPGTQRDWPGVERRPGRGYGVSGQLAGKRALVTGAAAGIGRAVSIALAREGAQVALADRAPLADGNAVAAEITASGGNAFALQCDVSNEREVLALFEAAVPRLGGLDILVNNAGILIEKPLLETTAAGFPSADGHQSSRRVPGGARGHSRHAWSRCGGRVINVASELAYLGRERCSIYCASKGGIVSMTRSWAREFAPQILVNAVAPGPTDTAMLGADTTTPETLAKDMQNPLGRIAQPEEIASAALFLAGPGATFMTGQCISPNGGAVMF